MDWETFEDDLVAGIVEKVTEHADTSKRLYAAALAEIYAETDHVIRLPMLGVVSYDEVAADDALLWSVPDWKTQWFEWLPEERWQRWENELSQEAGRSSTLHWNRTFARYLLVLTRVCKRARKQLQAAEITDGQFAVVLLTDDDEEEGLLRRILSEQELYRLFPRYEQVKAWQAEMDAKEPADRAVHYVRLLNEWHGSIGPEEAELGLRELGPAAHSALIDLLSHGPRKWEAAKLLADIGEATDEVIEALTHALRHTTGPDRQWTAAALSRLNRLDVVLSAPDLPTETIVTAVAAPYRAFRDHAITPQPLTYAPLERFLADHPQLRDGISEKLSPGTSYCTIRAEEVSTAIDALRSSWPVVRRHAVCVLGERALGAAVGRQVIPRLAEAVVHDPDPTTRRLAILSLKWWKHDARPYADTGRKALHDPDPAVRATAQSWLDDLTQ
ncbi:uncharacterized protein DUF4303 [Actinomadura pelletieri DSM 43383]|uniref:Uncharacterized protein DUF4303 n=1 Tax=Actinomadura pelletieri DSM 43383 TaxID=1120940 RepID=A0A495R0Y9_9ACTN|nr:HEAT repeat domain-containing protein [Actinomadura pelletieri]RKS79884.1 uncharacterized protein DUF4303 [Actinomadura pelletieri DSM 43383]